MALHFVPRKPRAEQIKELEAEWKKNPRWKGVKRGYNAEGRGQTARHDPTPQRARRARRRQAVGPA